MPKGLPEIEGELPSEIIGVKTPEKGSLLERLARITKEAARVVAEKVIWPVSQSEDKPES